MREQTTFVVSGEKAAFRIVNDTHSSTTLSTAKIPRDKLVPVTLLKANILGFYAVECGVLFFKDFYFI